MSAQFRIRSAGLTHEGRVRDHNEDSLLLRDDVATWVVADGMGGHEKGEWASNEIVEAVRQAPLGADFDPAVAILADAVHAANARIHQAGVEGGKRMGSTVVALHISGSLFACLWAGDSRIYLLRDGALHQLTRDHTQVQDMVDAGLMAAREAKGHPMSHVLSRAVGVQAVLELDAISDEIAALMTSASPEAACRRLVDLTLSRGAPDNVTVIAVVCEEVTALSFAGVGGSAG